MEEIDKERFFSVELKSKVNLKNVTVNENSQENVLVEGTLGKLEHTEFADGVVLEVFGDKGVLRVNLTIDDIKKSVNADQEVKK
ncbi:MAG TPA: hypothetical protein VK536_06535 [Candidatus Limnocylindrales bacterium]|nr:hypothetical protein [Candidatus Limnocylindrales bacterium]